MADVLVTISGEVPANIRSEIMQRKRPRADYIAMADVLDADLIDYAEARRAAGPFGHLLEKVGGANLLLAWSCYRQRARYKVIFTDGEQIGIPLAWMCKFGGRRHTRHLMIAHVLSVGKKKVFFDLFRIQSHIDTFLVYSTAQKQFVEARLRAEKEQVTLMPFMVDSNFFTPVAIQRNPRRMICAVGLEFRDYQTLIDAVRGLDVEVVIAAASPWSKRRDKTQGVELPDNVTVRRFSQYDLRQLYADSLFVVMPLENADFQVGVTAILEAMAMHRAVICSRIAGQTDIIIDGETGLYVPTNDVDALRDAIEYLLEHPELAAKMGKRGRDLVEREMSLDRYTERLHRFIHESVAM